MTTPHRILLVAQNHCSSHDFIPGLFAWSFADYTDLRIYISSYLGFFPVSSHILLRLVLPLPPTLKPLIQAPCPFSRRAHLLGVAEAVESAPAASLPASFIPHSSLKDFSAARSWFPGAAGRWASTAHLPGLVPGGCSSLEQGKQE